jgi:rare lipoprotein A (peptidoglycan hydrolase)
MRASFIVLFSLAALLFILNIGCKRNPPPPRAAESHAEIALASPSPKDSPEKRRRPLSQPRVVNAVWYHVPVHSLAKSRAGIAEFTAAHNHLPLGTLVRVTNVQNSKSVVVRITDRGITNRRAKIDICKEAAEQLGMIGDGIARVRLEVLDDAPVPAASDPTRPAAH